MDEDNNYFIIESGNKQILCKAGEKILVDKLSNVEIGNEVSIKRLFDGIKVSNDHIKCIVNEPLVLGEKKIIYKTRRRKGYEKKNGFRAQYTSITIGGK